jgi:hypothetical protein
MPNRQGREAAIPCPVLDWANNPRTHDDRDRLQHLVRRIHTRHPLNHASADVKDRGWSLHIISDVTKRLTTVPASIMVRRAPDGTTVLPPPTHYGRDLVAELATALDEAGRYVTHPTIPPFKATLLEMAVIRSVCSHDEFVAIARQPLEIPHVEWRDDAWRVDQQPSEGTLRPGNGRFVEYVRTEDWGVRRVAKDWEFDRHRLHIVGATLPESIAEACRGKPFDDVFDVPDLLGAGLVIRAVKNSRRAGGPSLRVTVDTRRLTDVAEAIAMSRSMAHNQEGDRP